MHKMRHRAAGRKPVLQSVRQKAGAKKALIMEEPMAAAIGAHLCVEEPTGNMVVDIGGGTADIAVISLGGAVVNTSIKLAGDDFDEAKWPNQTNYYWKNLLRTAPTEQLEKIYQARIGDLPKKEVK